jgi:hypothetical protein
MIVKVTPAQVNIPPVIKVGTKVYRTQSKQ